MGRHRGESMFDAIQTAMGKPGSPLRALYFGTLAPGKGQWWLDLVKRGSSETRFVTCLQGTIAKWDQLSEVKRVNPLTWRFPDSRKVLLDEREEALRDESAKSRVSLVQDELAYAQRNRNASNGR